MAYSALLIFIHYNIWQPQYDLYLKQVIEVPGFKFLCHKSHCSGQFKQHILTQLTDCHSAQYLSIELDLVIFL